jgi:hypothetical protein
MTAQDTQLRFIEPVLLLIVRTGPGGCRWACGVAAAGGGIELAAYAAPCLQRSSEPTPTEVQPRLLVTMKAASDVSSAGIHFKPVLSSTAKVRNFEIRSLSGRFVSCIRVCAQQLYAHGVHTMYILCTYYTNHVGRGAQAVRGELRDHNVRETQGPQALR